jgi:hypothetical protein
VKTEQLQPNGGMQLEELCDYQQNPVLTVEYPQNATEVACTWSVLNASSSGVGCAKQNGREIAWAIIGLDSSNILT